MSTPPPDGPSTASPSASDERLMQLAQQGDGAAFSELYRRHSPAVLGMVRRTFSTRGLAEDALQEAFLSVWRHRASYVPARGSVRSWILAIAHHRAIDVLRKTRRHDRRPGDDDEQLVRLASPQRTDEQVLAREERATLQDALRLLPAEQATSLALAYFDGLTHSEIGELVGAPLGTVKGRIRLGLAKLSADPGLAA